MAKKKSKKKRGDKRTKITITQVEILASTSNPIHLSHLTNGIKGGAFGGSKRDRRRRERREEKRRGDE